MATCPACKIPFEPTPANPTYCTPACRPEIRAERERERQLALAEAAARRKAGEKIRQATTDAARRTKPKSRTRSERFATLNAFVDMGMVDLTGTEAKVWLVLFRDTKGDGTARTAQADIARRAGLSVRGVKLALRKLQTKGMVQVIQRGRLNSGPSTYRLHPTGATWGK